MVQREYANRAACELGLKIHLYCLASAYQFHETPKISLVLKSISAGGVAGARAWRWERYLGVRRADGRFYLLGFLVS